MKVGLNLVFLTPGEQGGMETYVRELLPRLAQIESLDLTVFAGRNCAGQLIAPAAGVREVVVDVDARDRKQWVLGEQVHLPRLAKAAGCHVVHSLASTAPLRGAFKRVTTVHDLNYKLVPDTHSGARGLGMRVLVPAAVRRSHRVIVDAASTADDLVAHLGTRRDKIDVVPLAVTEQPAVTPTPERELRERLGLGGSPLLLTFSAKRPHKNLMRLIEAHAALPVPRPVLMLPGYATPYEDDLRARVEQLGTTADVRFEGWISDEDREGLYAIAAAFAFPSLYEGFGFPPLEAMARGVPVVTTDRGSLAEVVGGAALTVDPDSTEQLRDAIARLLTDESERERLKLLGREQVAKFSWDETARLTAESYARALDA